MPNLALFKFNNLSNTAFTNDAWYVGGSATVNALAGNDIITARAASHRGFYYDGIHNAGTINTGTGLDRITGTGLVSYSGHGILNGGNIFTGSENDTIKGIGRIGSSGIANGTDGTIDTGSGNDLITGRGALSSYPLPGVTGISNGGVIMTGIGSDRIRGIGNSGINNGGLIDTGDGNDIVDAIRGGFSNSGTIDLGIGNDILKGFAKGYQYLNDGKFNGGAGDDRILFSQGVYKIMGGTIRSGGLNMYVEQFERVGGVNSGLFSLQNGTLTVNSLGAATFTL